MGIHQTHLLYNVIPCSIAFLFLHKQIIAVVAIGLGLWIRNDEFFLVTSDTEFYLDLPLMTCIGGAVTFVVAFLGCIGALREHLVLLKVVSFHVDVHFVCIVLG